jgi:hypothetical protein
MSMSATHCSHESRQTISVVRDCVKEVMPIVEFVRPIFEICLATQPVSIERRYTRHLMRWRWSFILVYLTRLLLHEHPMLADLSFAQF